MVSSPVRDSDWGPTKGELAAAAEPAFPLATLMRLIVAEPSDLSEWSMVTVASGSPEEALRLGSLPAVCFDRGLADE